MAVINPLNDKYTESYELFGLYKALPTGRVYDENTIEVKVGKHKLPASVCMAFGTLHVPSEKWLKKYKNEIFIWVAFEQGLPNKCVWLGWSYIKDKDNKDKSSYPDSRVTRTEQFNETFDDSNSSWKLYQIEGNKQFIHIAKQLIEVYAKELLIRSKETTTVDAKKVIIKSNEIKLVGDSANQSAVRGDDLVDILKAQNSLLQNIIQELITFGTLQATASGTPYTTGLVAGFTNLAKNMGGKVADMSKLIANTEAKQYLSKYIKLT